MKRLSKTAYDDIRLWVYRNARQIDLAVWQYEFEGGGREAVLSALSHYQNADGGFGNALEPDSWNPASSPYTTLNAAGILKNVNYTDIDNPIMQGMLRFFESGKHCVENGWLFNIPSNNDYPCAPWWNYDEKANEYEHIGVTAGIACFALRFAAAESGLYRRACAFASHLLAKFREQGNKGDMGLTGYCMLLDTIKSLGLTDQFDISY
jgi:hypothetical protein